MKHKIESGWLMAVVLLSLAAVRGAHSRDPQSPSSMVPEQEIQKQWRESLKAEAEGRMQDAFDIVRAMPQDAHAVFRQAKLLVARGECTEALLALDAVLQAAPEMPSLLSYVAYCQMQTGDLEGSAKTCARALQQEPMEFRAIAILRQLPAHISSQHSQVVEEHHRKAAEAHAREGITDPPQPPSHLNVQASSDLTLITSVNSLYFGCVANHIGSVQLREPGLRILLYDLGLDPLEKLVAREWRSVTLVPFPFQDYPPHVRNLRNYAWKPLVYKHALASHRKVFYQDSGQEVWQRLGKIDSIIERDGYMFVMQGERTLPDKIHPSMFKVMGLDPKDFAGKDMCAGGIQGYRNDSLAVDEVLSATVACALNPRCIAPDGADQSNHRFDQSAFSINMASGMYRCHNSWLFRAYLEPHRLKEADTHDVGDG
eukprot:CAMPEP_0114121086 /NCGR_PEP_ID=MMETSP0043_2-20121206/6995_1 /TAXON_ID=464988 /ORGANISM="Hemiselmis andersenii, Strain CCMP644" /LENGTH=427 /DNA_ID=CAMNT_0001213753 /DNA_START=56 /DNA_END=1335 /DNA_ORIENTATION=+